MIKSEVPSASFYRNISRGLMAAFATVSFDLCLPRSCPGHTTHRWELQLSPVASPYRGAACCGAACSGPRAAAPWRCRTDAVGWHGGAGSSEINESQSGRGGARGEASIGGQKRPQFAFRESANFVTCVGCVGLAAFSEELYLGSCDCSLSSGRWGE